MVQGPGRCAGDRRQQSPGHALYGQLRPQIDALPDWHQLGVRHEAMSGVTVPPSVSTSLYNLNDHWALRGQCSTAYKLPNAERLFVNEADGATATSSRRKAATPSWALITRGTRFRARVTLLNTGCRAVTPERCAVGQWSGPDPDARFRGRRQVGAQTNGACRPT